MWPCLSTCLTGTYAMKRIINMNTIFSIVRSSVVVSVYGQHLAKAPPRERRQYQ